MGAKHPCILFLLDWRPVFWSTREEFFRRLCRCLSRRGIAPVMIVSDVVTVDTRRRFEQAGARLIACPYHARPFEYWAQIRDVAREYTVLFAHVRFFDYFTALFWMCRLSGIRAVMFTEANSGEWKGSGWKAALIRLRAAVMCSPLVQLIAISEFIRNRLEALGIPREKLTVVYNGVDLSSFHPDAELRRQLREQMGAQPETVVLIYMAVLLNWKRPEVTLHVCANLSRRGMDVQLWMAGQGPLQASLETLAKELQIENRVRWLGHQPDPQRWLASADVFLHAAVGEAFGNVLVEALGCGLPIVATRSGATPELIEEDVNGKLVATGSMEIEQLADAVESITRDRQRYLAFSQAARLSATRFTTDLSVEQTMRVYAPWVGPATGD